MDVFSGQQLNKTNSQLVIISGVGTTVIGSGATLTLNLSVTASPGFLGTKNIYMVAEDSEMLSSGWQKLGTWTPNADTAPTADAVTPTPASSANQTLAPVLGTSIWNTVRSNEV